MSERERIILISERKRDREDRKSIGRKKKKERESLLEVRRRENEVVSWSRF